MAEGMATLNTDWYQKSIEARARGDEAEYNRAISKVYDHGERGLAYCRVFYFSAEAICLPIHCVSKEVVRTQSEGNRKHVIQSATVDSNCGALLRYVQAEELPIGSYDIG
jgi:hypothetical protein